MNNHDNIRGKLKEFEVDVPDFQIKKSMVDRLANWVFEPVPVPMSKFSLTGTGALVTSVLPIVITIASIFPLLFL